MIKKVIWAGVGLAVCGLIYLAVTNWEAFKITMGALFGIGLGAAALKAKKKKHQANIKKTNKKKEKTLAEISKPSSFKSRISNRNKRARKRK